MIECNNLKCSAPMCPLEKDHTEVIWFPLDEICTMHSKPWIKRQRKIQNKTKSFDTYYTFKMLNRSITIGRAIKGIDPDKDMEEEEKRWMSKHPVKKEMSEERKRELRERFNKMRAEKPL
jgi:hypothetical protein